MAIFLVSDGIHLLALNLIPVLLNPNTPYLLLDRLLPAFPELLLFWLELLALLTALLLFLLGLDELTLRADRSEDLVGADR